MENAMDRILHRSVPAALVLGAALPRASEKAEGAMPQSERVSSAAGQLILNRNRFFDGQIFDPVPAI